MWPTLIKKLSKLEKKHDMACKKESDKFALLMWDTAGTGRRAFFFFGQNCSLNTFSPLLLFIFHQILFY